MIYSNGRTKRYTVVAWLVDKRCYDNCRIQTYDTDTKEDAIKWTSKIKKAYGDSVKLIDNSDKGGEDYILLREDQIGG